MSAKKSRKQSPVTPSAVPAAAAVASPAAVAWIDSPDPKKRQYAKLILAGVWIYVAALWLLALDQWFHWGIFGPKVPPG